MNQNSDFLEEESLAFRENYLFSTTVIKSKFSVKCQEGSRVARKRVYFYSFFEGARFFPECNLLSCIFYDLFIGSGLLQNWGCVSISKVVFGI